MKHLKFNAFLLILLLSMAGITAAAHNIEVANEDGKTIYYSWRNNNTELAVSYQGSSYSSYSNEYSGNVVIPESVTYNGVTYPVTRIYSEAFRSCSGLTSVTIPNSVTSIGNSAFYKCSGLIEVNYNATNCTSMGSSGYPVFNNCTSLTTLNIGDNVKKIPAYAFYKCSSLTSVDFPNSVTSIGNSAFQYCSGLAEVNYNATNCISMGSSDYPVFKNCTSLNILHIGDNVQNIPAYAFSYCSSLTSVDIPNSVTSIGNSAFYKCI